MPIREKRSPAEIREGKGISMAALFVYLQNTVARLRERQEGQTMAEYALILGGIAIVVILAIVFLGGKIDELFRATGSSVTNPVS
jgi:Flp pilus assembly pilin Flp